MFKNYLILMTILGINICSIQATEQSIQGIEEKSSLEPIAEELGGTIYFARNSYPTGTFEIAFVPTNLDEVQISEIWPNKLYALIKNGTVFKCYKQKHSSTRKSLGAVDFIANTINDVLTDNNERVDSENCTHLKNYMHLMMKDYQAKMAQQNSEQK